MILFLHSRYRTPGGEERVVGELARLVRDRLGEDTTVLSRSSAGASRARAAAGLLRGGLEPAEVSRAVRESGARVVHAHNLQPTLGWRSLAAARDAGARVVVHLHQYRLVCAVGVCFTRGAECTRCHGRDTTPGIRLNCRGSIPEALAYGAALSLWQRRIGEIADEVIVPSDFAARRLRELGAPLDWDRVHVLPPPVEGAGPPSPAREPYAIVVSRLSREKGVDVAIDACRAAGMPLVIAGDGPERAELAARAAGADVRLEGWVEQERLASLRAGARLALVPSRSAETFGLAAAEAMAAGVPVIASAVGALPELVEPGCLVPAGDPAALAGAIAALGRDPDAGVRAAARVAGVCAPAVVAAELARIYDGDPRRPPRKLAV